MDTDSFLQKADVQKRKENNKQKIEGFAVFAFLGNNKI